MEEYLITARSVTHAQRMAQVLERLCTAAAGKAAYGGGSAAAVGGGLRAHTGFSPS